MELALGVSLLLLLQGVLQLAFILLSGSVKVIFEMGANGTLLNEGGSQEQGIEVHDRDFLA